MSICFIQQRDCFKCVSCSKRIDSTINASIYDFQLYCKSCFTREGLARKQAEVKWSGASTTKAPVNPAFAKLGGGGIPCTACQKTVYTGEQVNYDGKPYHKECISCSVCKNKATINNVNSFEDELICTSCWNAGGYNQKQLAKRAQGATSTSAAKAPLNPALAKLGGGGTACTACQKTVYTGEQVNYDGKPYHKECINCSVCKNKATINNVNSFDGELICLTCWNAGGYNLKQLSQRAHGTASTSAPKAPVNPAFAKLGGGGTACTACQKTVYTGEQVNYDGKPYHKDCISCTVCKNKTTINNVNSFDGDLICLPCWNAGGYNQKQLAKRATGASSASTAKAPLNPALAKLGGGGNKCNHCNKTVYPAEQVNFEKGIYHRECLICGDCNKRTTVASLNIYEGKLVCGPCWASNGYARLQLFGGAK